MRKEDVEADGWKARGRNGPGAQSGFAGAETDRLRVGGLAGAERMGGGGRARASGGYLPNRDLKKAPMCQWRPGQVSKGEKPMIMVLRSTQRATGSP